MKLEGTNKRNEFKDSATGKTHEFRGEKTLSADQAAKMVSETKEDATIQFRDSKTGKIHTIYPTVLDGAPKKFPKGHVNQIPPRDGDTSA